jgi:hypothetical protein
METAPGWVHPSVYGLRSRCVPGPQGPGPIHLSRPGPAQFTRRRCQALLSARLPTRRMGLRYCPSDGRSGTKRMSRTSHTKRYYEIARDCLRSAQHAHNSATRDKLLDQAQMWMDTAIRETFVAAIGASNPHEPSLPDLRRKIRVVRLGSKKSPARERG